MKVYVISRLDAVFYSYEPHDQSTIMISISDPNMEYAHSPFCSAENGIVDILPLCFADADRPGTDVYGRDAGIQDLMSDKDAECIVEFLTKHPNVDVIVHCDAGISRSSGVAAAILKYLTGDDSSIFDNARLHPNMWCYRKTLNALIAHEEQQKNARVAELEYAPD